MGSEAVLNLCKRGGPVDRSDLKAGYGVKALLIARSEAEGRRKLLQKSGQGRTEGWWGCRATSRLRGQGEELV